MHRVAVNEHDPRPISSNPSLEPIGELDISGPLYQWDSPYVTLEICGDGTSSKLPKTMGRNERSRAKSAPAATHRESLVTETLLLDLIGPPRSALVQR